MDGYRAITVSPILSKIFEIGMEEKLKGYLETSDLQFGFKKNLSCSHAIFSVRSVVDHFVSHGSTVNICSMDLSKAFDRVNHYGLFVKLLERRIPLIFVLLLECWYTKIFVFVRWGDCLSSKVSLKAGVRQGGILSPLFFVVYVDVVLEKLKNSRLGCYIRGLFFGAIMYADDLMLLAASVTELQRMISLCKDLLDGIDMIINSSKTMCLRIGRGFNANCVNLVVGLNSLKWVSSVRYLGVFIQSYKVFRVVLDDARKRFYMASNSILSKVCKDQIAVVLSLTASYCTPILLYGLEAVTLNKAERSRLNNPFNMIFSKLFGTYDKSVIKSCQLYCGYLPFNLLLDMKILRFYRKFINLDNSIVNQLFSINGMHEFLSIAYKYDVKIDDSDRLIKKKIWTVFVND